MPVGFGRVALKVRGRSLSVVAHLKRRIVEVKAEENCVAHALVIAIAMVDNDTNYKAYLQGRKIRSVIQTLLQGTSIDLTNDGVSLKLTVSKNFLGIIFIKVLSMTT